MLTSNCCGASVDEESERCAKCQEPCVAVCEGEPESDYLCGLPECQHCAAEHAYWKWYFSGGMLEACRPVDDETYRREMKEAGRGHLLP